MGEGLLGGPCNCKHQEIFIGIWNVNVDGKKDGEIQHGKSEVVESEGHKAITMETAKLLFGMAGSDEHCKDPFAGIDEDEEEKTKTVPE